MDVDDDVVVGNVVVAVAPVTVGVEVSTTAEVVTGGCVDGGAVVGGGVPEAVALGLSSLPVGFGYGPV